MKENLLKYLKWNKNPQPSVEQQLKIWAFTHPKPNESTILFGTSLTPYEVLQHVQQGTEFGNQYVQFLEDSAKKCNIPRASFLQQAIEANLRPQDEKPALDSKSRLFIPSNKYNRAVIVHEAYEDGIMKLEGVVGMGTRFDFGSKGPSIHLLLATQDLTDKLPIQLEGVPTNFKIVEMEKAVG